jgi:hypothetical protein
LIWREIRSCFPCDQCANDNAEIECPSDNPVRLSDFQHLSVFRRLTILMRIRILTTKYANRIKVEKIWDGSILRARLLTRLCWHLRLGFRSAWRPTSGSASGPTPGSSPRSASRPTPRPASWSTSASSASPSGRTCYDCESEILRSLSYFSGERIDLVPNTLSDA